jgi:putative endonuclease
MERSHIAVYIMANSRRTLYIGVTNDLLRRVYEHKTKLIEGYASRYNLTKLVHYESYVSMQEAIGREKQLKGWLRAKKVTLIEEHNPFWHDLAADWYARDSSTSSE